MLLSVRERAALVELCVSACALSKPAIEAVAPVAELVVD